uniref:Ras-GEF domain-containing protein n=1 Tax=Timema cristinae TaxID=61476 RepID=A0A7R9DDT5_TIMCR|nr:unnamed protein product [Timema cristinae]
MQLEGCAIVIKWSKVQSAKFSILEHQMDPSSNFSSYRSTLKAAMWRSAGATDERQRIVIPFFSLLVKDLYFLNEGCSSKLPNGHINFEKFWQLAKQVTEFITWKQVVCPFEKNTKVITFLQASPVLLENALALASFECEPPDNNLEKERYKTLKVIKVRDYMKRGIWALPQDLILKGGLLEEEEEEEEEEEK